MNGDNNKTVSHGIILLLLMIVVAIAIFVLYSSSWQQILSGLEQVQENNNRTCDSDFNILIVGDSIAEGSGASDYNHSWAKLLSNRIDETYGLRTRLTNVSMGGNTSYAGYVRTMALDDNIDYDLVIICYGQNDSEKNFSLYYESIIRCIKKKYSHAFIITVLESSQKTYTDKIKTIQSLSSYYAIPAADTIAPFMTDYDSLVKDGVHPNDEGHKIYCESIFDVIRSNVNIRKQNIPDDITVVNESVTVFDSFRWIGAESFVRDGNCFSLETSMNGTVLGMDYYLVSGINRCRILIDGEEFASPDVNYAYDYNQRIIHTVNRWLEGKTVNIKHKIEIVFPDDESGEKQADRFNGIAIS